MFFLKSVKYRVTLTFNKDLDVNTLKASGKTEIKTLLGGKECKVKDVSYGGSVVGFTLTGNLRVLKLPTKYLKR